MRRLIEKNIKRLAGDRGYRGKKEIDGTQILISGTPQNKDTHGQRKKKHHLFCKRAGIKPTIGHFKSGYRFGDFVIKDYQGML